MPFALLSNSITRHSSINLDYTSIGTFTTTLKMLQSTLAQFTALLAFCSVVLSSPVLVTTTISTMSDDQKVEYWLSKPTTANGQLPHLMGISLPITTMQPFSTSTFPIMTTISTMSNGRKVEYWLSKPTTANGQLPHVIGGPLPITTMQPFSTSTFPIMTTISTMSNGRKVEYWLSKPTTANGQLPHVIGGPLPITTMQPFSSSLLWTTTISAMSNDGEVEYWLQKPTTANGQMPQKIGGPLPITTLQPFSSSLLYSGKHMKVNQPTTTSANVGTLTGAPLYTAISGALMSACTATPAGGPSGSITSCGDVPKITGIVWTDDDGSWDNSAELELTVQAASYYDMDSLHGMIASIAAAINGSSLNPSSNWSPKPVICNELAGWCTADDVPGGAPKKIANIPGWIEVIFSQDTAEAHDWPVQNLIIEFATPSPHGDFICADGALVTDALAALSLIPGLEFLAFMAIPALGVSAACDGYEHAVVAGGG